MTYSPNEFMQTREILEEARQTVAKSLGSSGSYAWLTGALTVNASLEDAKQILKTAKEFYGDK